MLVELRLENFAVIENIAVEFGAGLNLLTGETGAGKSMLIDALALLLGGKASPDVQYPLRRRTCQSSLRSSKSKLKPKKPSRKFLKTTEWMRTTRASSCAAKFPPRPGYSSITSLQPFRLTQTASW